MLRRIRLHIIALLTISIVIMMLYGMMFQLKPAEPDNPINRFKVFMLSATWGENCNTNIRAAIASGQRKDPELDQNGNPLPPKPYELVKKDNVLDLVSAVCNGQLICTFKANRKLITLDPFPGCYKKFDLTYRCFNTDRLRFVHSNEGAEVKLDCTPPKEENKPAPGSAPNPAGKPNAPAPAK